MDSEILYMAKRKDTGEWVEGFYINHSNAAHYIIPIHMGGYEALDHSFYVHEFYEVIPSTICKYATLSDNDKCKIWENSIYSWVDPAYGKCSGIVQYGKYEQDGSAGEYPASECLGFYVKVLNVEGFEWDTKETAEESYPPYLRTISLFNMLNKDMQYMGNRFDNPELLEKE